LAVTPDQSKVYVANWISNTVSVIDPRNNNVITTISVGKGPRNVTITPDGEEAWVSNQFNQSISVIDTATNQVVATIFVEEEPGKIVFTIDGMRACVVNYGSGTVTVIETKTYEVKWTFAVGPFPEDIAINLASDEQWTYVASRGNHSITVINVVKGERSAPISLRMEPWGLAVSDNKLYITTFSMRNTPGILLIFNIAEDNKVVANITMGSEPYRLLLSPDHSRLYVANSWSSSIYVIDTKTSQLTFRTPLNETRM
jgi:YVTN family beta-propeller protein